MVNRLTPALLLFAGLSACGANGTTPPTSGGASTVTISGVHVRVPASANVSNGSRLTVNVTADPGYTLANTVGGTCPSGSWNASNYTTGVITGNCTLAFSATIDRHSVNANGDGHVTITPAGAQSVGNGSTQAFTVTASSGYMVSNSVGGTCPSGSWSGSTYTTGAITSDCTVTFSATNNPYAVTASGDGHEDIMADTAQSLTYGSTQDFTVTANTGYTLSDMVGGTCAAGSWKGSTYTTGAITASCTVTFSAILNTYTVTPGGDGHVAFTPATLQLVNHGSTQAFAVTADAGYTLSNTVTGTCPTGSWNGTTYTTGAITSNCTVTFAVTVSTYSVTASGDGHEVITTPNSAETVNYGGTQAFTVTANPDYTVNTTVGGTCPAGSWSGHTYTTGSIASNCTVIFSAINTYSVTPSGDGHEAITPNIALVVGPGSTPAFTVTANTGYTLSAAVGGTCPSGQWSGSTYTTGPITSSCTVTFSAVAAPVATYSVMPSGDGSETITPNTAQTVTYGGTQTFTVTANAGATLSETVGGTCPSGSWSGSTYTTGTITSNCTVVFAAVTPATYSVTPSGDGYEVITPHTVQTVSRGGTQAFTVEAMPGHTLTTTVLGNCPAGSWSADTYTTGPIIANCTVTFLSTFNSYSVTPSGDGHEVIAPNTAQTVSYASTHAFTVTAAAGYTLSNVVGGSCSAGSWSGGTYTTGPIVSNCTVSFSATLDTHSVTPSGDGHEMITPNTAQTVNHGSTQAFTVTADAGYTISNSVGGTCPAGSWSGGTYTTGAITANCTISFSATLNTYSVTPSGDGNEGITPNTAQTVNHGSTQAFTVTANSGYTVDGSVGGTCPAGSWSGGTYTTGAITANCTISFSATLNTYSVTPSGDGHEGITPNTAQTVNHGSTQAFVVAANAGYTVDSSVGGTCPAGSWSGGTYTTGAITANCTVSFSATLNTYSVTPSGDGHEGITPNTAQTVNHGSTQAFAVAANSGYTVDNSVGGTCPAGSWSGGTYTTGAITANCTVSFSATLNTYSVTPSGDGHEGITPNTAQTVNHGSTQAFAVTANMGYTVDNSVGGTCAAGSWSGGTYTTGAITANCTVTFSATLNSYTVTPSGDGHEGITPNTAQTVNYGSTQAFTVTANSGYSVSNTVGGTCPAGSWSGGTYTTGAISSNCSVSFSATLASQLIAVAATDTLSSPQSSHIYLYNYDGSSFTLSGTVSDATLGQSGFGTDPNSIAFDGSGNLFEVDYGLNQALYFSHASIVGATPSVTRTITQDMISPYSVSASADGSLLAVLLNQPQAIEFSTAGQSSNTVTSLYFLSDGITGGILGTFIEGASGFAANSYAFMLSANNNTSKIGLCNGTPSSCSPTFITNGVNSPQYGISYLVWDQSAGKLYLANTKGGDGTHGVNNLVYYTFSSGTPSAPTTLLNSVANYPTALAARNGYVAAAYCALTPNFTTPGAQAADACNLYVWDSSGSLVAGLNPKVLTAVSTLSILSDNSLLVGTSSAAPGKVTTYDLTGTMVTNVTLGSQDIPISTSTYP